MIKLALFDLDHTLLPLDSDYSWADFLARTGRAGEPQQAQQRNQQLFEDYCAGTLDIHGSAGFMLSLIAQKPPEILAQWQAEFMQQVIHPAIHPAAQALVRQHQQAGDICAIVTATNSFVTRPIADLFGIKTLLATQAECQQGIYTGRVVGEPCFREAKIRHVYRWLAESGYAITDLRHQVEASVFYSDSSNDLPLLNSVMTPVATNPSADLRSHALKQGWRILDLFT